MKLNEGQEKAKTEIINTIESDTLTYHTLSGSAGTGKTTLIANVIESLPLTYSIGIATPTHKATKVARTMGIKTGLVDRCTYGTIHSFMCIKPIRKGGEEVYVKDKNGVEKSFDVLFIDESSMLDETMINIILDSKSKTIIFIGDSYQINPVNSDDGEISLVFDPDNVDCTSTLTKIERHDNPIINLATKFKEHQDNKLLELPEINTSIDDIGDGIIRLTPRDLILEAYNNVNSAEFKENSDYCRIVTYTNASVEKLNNIIRKKLHGDDVDEYIEGEVIVSQQGKLDILRNAEEFVIKKVSKLYDEENDLEYFELHIKSLEDDRDEYVGTLTEESKAIYDIRLAKYADEANEAKYKANNTSDKNNKSVFLSQSKYHWNKFWTLKDAYIDFKHIYACTAHKSQGSTFVKTFIFLPDFIKWGIEPETLQLIYTGITRSSKVTYIGL